MYVAGDEKLGIIDPELDELLKAGKAPVITLEMLQNMIEHRTAMKDEAGGGVLASSSKLEGVTFYDRTIPTRAGTTNVRVYKPADPAQANGGPLVVLYHGGGFCLGDPSDEDPDAQLFTTRFGATCVSIRYRLAPEHPFPAAIEDAWDGLQWAAAEAKTELHADPSKGFLLSGISAGGTISAVMSRLARDNKLHPPLTGIHLSAPGLGPIMGIPPKYCDEYLSHKQNADAPIFGLNILEFFAEKYKADPTSPLANVLCQDKSTHANLPPHFFQVCGLDTVRDASILYERELREKGVGTRIVVYPGQTHGFWSMFPQFEQAKKCRKDLEEGVAWLLDRGRAI